MTLLAAGHETTATALCWAFEQILLHPGVHARIVAELDAVAPEGALRPPDDGAASGPQSRRARFASPRPRAPLGPEQLARLEYLDATIKEALRGPR
jgi:cytochrome P450